MVIFFTSCGISGCTVCRLRIQHAPLRSANSRVRWFIGQGHMTRAWRLKRFEPLQVSDSVSRHGEDAVTRMQTAWTKTWNMKTTCKKHVKQSASSILLVANCRALKWEERRPETVNSRRACQACLKYMKWPPTIFQERNYTVAVTGSAPNAKRAFFFPSIEFMKAGSPSRDSYFPIFYCGGCVFDKALSHITPNYNITCVIQTQSEERGSIFSVAGGVRP